MAKLSIDQMLMKARYHEKKNEILDAQKLYQSILRTFPKNKRAQDGIVALNKSKQNNDAENPPQEAINQLIKLYNQGQFLSVVKQARTLVNQHPEAFIVWSILGVSAAQIGMQDQAIQAFNKSILLKPNYAETYSNKGNVLKDQGKLDEAIISYNKAISLKPDFAEVYNNMGVALQNQGKLDKAIEAYNSALLLKPNYAETYSNMGNVLQDLGNLDQAIEAHKKSILFNPECAETFNNMGNVLKDQGKLQEAIEAHKKSISLKPDYAEAYNNLGIVLKDQGKLDEAIKAYNKAFLLKPDYAEAYNNIGNVFKDQGKLEKAIEALKKSILLKPNYAAAYNNLGIALKKQDKGEEAIEAYNKALLLKPDYAEAYSNLGMSLIDEGKTEEATEAYKKALLLKPDLSEARQLLSFALLKSGRLKEGLAEYEWRLKTTSGLSKQRHFTQPLWDGKTSLNGKRILLWCEQGIGDTLNWSSFFPLVTAQAELCIAECPKKLVSLLERSFPNVKVKPENRNLDLERDDFDVHLPMGSLYKHFFEEITQKSKPTAFLVPDPIRINYWKERLKSLGTGPYIGISWKSSAISAYRLKHYPPISEWSPILKIPDVTFINLQYVNFEDDLKTVQDELGVKVHHFDDLDQYNNVDDVAALCAALDMVVSTKVTPPFISSAVGTPTKIANWRQSSFNTILTNPMTSSFEMYNRNTWELWDDVFYLIAEDILKLDKN
ncbi:tetratricopeptide repeat protein [Pseudomonadota bacterium]|nr:tetratricopeptide repeat protein [Pseudomonadota bacterium]